MRLALVTSVTWTPPCGPPVKFQRRNVSIFPKSNSPAAALSRAPGTFSSSQRSFRLLKYVLSGNPVCAPEAVLPAIAGEARDIFRHARVLPDNGVGNRLARSCAPTGP